MSIIITEADSRGWIIRRDGDGRPPSFLWPYDLKWHSDPFYYGLKERAKHYLHYERLSDSGNLRRFANY